MTVEEIERAVAKLPAEDLARFAAWFAEFEIVQFADDGVYYPTEEEKIGIERGLRDAVEGRFATAEELPRHSQSFAGRDGYLHSRRTRRSGGDTGLHETALSGSVAGA